MKPFFDIDDEELRGEFVEEGFIAEVQYEIALMLKRKGVSRSELARRLGVSAPYVSQLLGDSGGNITCRTIARIYSALGEYPSICAHSALDNRLDSPNLSDEAKSWFEITSSAVNFWSAGGVVSVGSDEPAASQNEAEIVWLDAYRRAA